MIFKKNKTKLFSKELNKIPQAPKVYNICASTQIYSGSYDDTKYFTSVKFQVYNRNQVRILKRREKQESHSDLILALWLFGSDKVDKMMAASMCL